jgi:uncharacterized protein (DUF433 family)
MVDAAVWVDPGRRSGEPCIGGTRIPTHMIASLVWDGGFELVRQGWPYLGVEQILGACWFEVTHGNRRKWRKVFPDWPKRYDVDEWAAR